MTGTSDTNIHGDPVAAEPEAQAISSSGWQEQDSILRDLWLQNLPPATIAERLDRSVAAIMTRAVRLGLPRRSAPGRKPGRRIVPVEKKSETRAARARTTSATAEAVNPETSLRICLMCLTKFPSEGRHNRICMHCKGSAEYGAASAIPQIAIESGL